ncbi:MAG: putative naringenin-chalcone synthase [Verrucomicrobiaceae bacterium]|nr:putative naringenin-chalcone synthase [Verrucomicrobiaceae bacterium]
MPACIHHISTEVPDFIYSQAFARDCMKSWSKEPRIQRIIHAIHDRSSIETRHSACGDFLPGREPELYKPGPDGIPLSPPTGDRNALYAKAARALAVKLARKTLEGAEGFEAKDITHIVFVSCTGFVNPGPDYHIIRELGLSENVQRYTLGFMGCYAAFPGLRMAAQFCEADPQAVVLVMCLELCTLHLQINDRPDSILANSLFADGAAAAIVSARKPAPGRPAYVVRDFTTSLVTSGEQDMAWTIGNEGFSMVLSAYVPDIIGSNIRQMLGDTLKRKGMALEEIQEWAVHPGGRAILDRVQDSLGLAPDALDASREVLRDYGNMSSATVLFVLKELLDSAETEHALTGAMAFGPGLTVETAVFERVGCAAAMRPVAAVPAAAGVAEEQPVAA